MTGDVAVDEGKINAVFADMPLEEISTLQQSAAAGIAALKSIAVRMGTEVGPEAMPTFEGLSGQLTKMDRVLRAQLKLRQDPGEADVATDSDSGQAAESSVKAVGAIRSRQDAIRALEAVAEFFRRNEPSSPIPLLVDRAKRLVSKDFLEVLADVAADALGQARAAGGIKQGE